MTTYNDIRRKSRTVKIGEISIGGDSPVAIQSMTNTDTHDYTATLAQIKALEAAGCDIVRMAVPDEEAVGVFAALKEAGVKIPLVADIHFDYRLAVAAAERGADKIRINPGNIGDSDRVRAVVEACRTHGVPIRVGVNSGSLEKKLLDRFGSPTPMALAESALSNVELLERFGFYDIVIAIKSSDVRTMVEANRILAERTDYPIHIGVTEAGSEKRGIVKSAVGIGSLLTSGIGDTLRVSLTANPVNEIIAAKSILEAAGLRRAGVNVISCPTCGRTKVDLIGLVNEFELRAAKEIKTDKPVTVAIMGCVVNGPGEAREADIGIAGGIGEVLLFRHGVPQKKIPQSNAIDVLIDEINRMGDE